MSSLVLILVAAWLSGLTAFLGGLAAWLEPSRETRLKREITHGIIAFGGGILVASVAFALTPEGIKDLSPLVLAAVFLLGGGVFCVLDIQLARRKGSVAQLMAMIMDFVPEAISLGAVFGYNPQLGLLLALMIGIQNLPEGYNSYRELRGHHFRKSAILISLFAISFLGPLSASLGYFLLQDRSSITASIMVFAAGGILYLIFQDIAPQARMHRHWTPPLGAVVGFMVGMLCHQWVL
ncbi:ZIP family metal transporter [Saccharospirillum salsuginis]|nr:divalent cation transporter [Saccharospirillum salsuginis]